MQENDQSQAPVVSFVQALSLLVAAAPLFALGAAMALPKGALAAVRRKDLSALTDYPFINGVKYYCTAVELGITVVTHPIWKKGVLSNLEDLHDDPAVVIVSEEEGAKPDNEFDATSYYH